MPQLKTRTMHRFFSLLAMLMAAMLSLASQGLVAATFTVTTNADSGAGSLRASVAAAVSGDTIVFNNVTSPITLASPITIAASVTISGPGANLLAISGNNATRIFNTSGTVTISGLTLQNGLANGTALVGGAINNTGSLTLDGMVLKSNVAFDGGGAIYNVSSGASTGQLKIRNSQLSGNSVSDASGIGGGAILSASTVGNAASVAIVNSTVTGNNANANAVGMAGGGIYFASGTLQIVSSTIVANRAGTAGGNVHQAGVANTFLSLRNSIISGGLVDATGAAPTDIDIFQPAGATVISLGYNIVTNRSAGTGYAATDAANGTNPVLGALAANGGPTQTILPLSMSPATGFVPLASCLDDAGVALTRDQRGVPRQASGATTCDAGATEASRLSITTTLPNGLLSTAYSQTLAAAGGLAPFTFSLSSGTLPAGLALAGGVISGTPTATGSSTFTIGVTDQTGASTTRAYTIEIQSAPAITTLTLPNGTVGTPYSTSIAATGSPAPAFTGSGLPPGLTLSSAGLLSGTPTTAGTYSAVKIDASNGVGAPASRTYTVVIAPPTFSLTVNLTGTAGGVVAGSGLACSGTTCTGEYAEGTSVLLSASANALQFFAGWSGGGCSGITNCAVTLNSNTTVNASFTASPALPTAKRNDFNGDGKSDIANQSADGMIGVVTMNGVTAVASGTVVGAGSGWSVTHIADFNGDNNADIVLKNADGRISLLLMNGTTVLSYTELYPAGTPWSVVKAADLDGDGKADLIIQHTNGMAAVLIMNGGTVISTSLLLEPGSPYTVTHTGDFNGDGKADIVLKRTDGAVAILIMNGGAIQAAGIAISAGPWSVIEVADFDGDRKADLVIKNTDGSVAVLLVNSLSVVKAGYVLLAGSPWSVSHTGDFNGDGKADILVKNSDGSVALLQMNGTAVSTASFILLAGSTSTVAQIADYNGDGKSDILLRTNDGSGTVVLMNGAVVTAIGNVWGAGTIQAVP